MGLAVAFIRSVVGLACAFAHDALADDEGRTFGLGLCRVESCANLVYVMTVNLHHVPAP